MQYFVLGVALLVGFLLLARWLTTANPAMLAWLLRLIGAVLLVAIPIVLVLTGNVQVIFFALPFALPVFFHWRSRQKRRRNAQGPTPGGTSSVDTGWLRMELDHDTGAMRGVVERGRFAGRSLEGLSLEELIELLDEVGADPDSVRVLEAYLDRAHGPDWRAGQGTEAPRGERAGHRGGHAGASGAMTEEEALEVLGLSPGASVEEIKVAHRRLMARLHPDRGGSTYLAAKLNEAKDRLLKPH